MKQLSNQQTNPVLLLYIVSYFLTHNRIRNTGTRLRI